MNKEEIWALFTRFEDARYEHEGVEYWSARELQTILGYVRWENFKVALERGRKACEGSGAQENDHFRELTKMVVVGSGAEPSRRCVVAVTRIKRCHPGQE